MSPLYCPHCYTPLAFPVDRCPSCHKSTANTVGSISRDTVPTSPFDFSSPSLPNPVTGGSKSSAKDKSETPLHTLDVPVVPDNTNTPQQTQPSSPWGASSSVPLAQEYLLPDENEFPTTLAPSQEMLAFPNLPPNTIQDAPVVSQIPPVRGLNSPWSGPSWDMTPAQAGAGRLPRESMLPSVREVLLPLEEEEPTMAASVDDIVSLQGASTQDHTEQVLPVVPLAEQLALDVAQEEIYPSFFLPPDTKEHPKHSETDPVGVRPLAEPARLSVSPPVSGEDTFDHLLQDLGLEQLHPPSENSDDNEGDAFGVWSADQISSATQEKSIHTLEQPKPSGLSTHSQDHPQDNESDHGEHKRIDSSPSLASVPLRSSFSPVPRSESPSQDNRMGLRLRGQSESADLSAVPSSSELSAGSTPRKRAEFRNKAPFHRDVQPQYSPNWQLFLHLVFWTLLLGLILGSGFLVRRYHFKAKSEAQTIKPATLNFNDILKE